MIEFNFWSVQIIGCYPIKNKSNKLKRIHILTYEFFLPPT